GLAQLGADYIAHEEGVVAGVVLGPDAAVEPRERTGDPRPGAARRELDSVPHRERRHAVGEVAGEPFLPAGEDAHLERAGAADEGVRRLLVPDRDPDERRLERERDERADGQAEPVALVVDRDDADRSRKPAHRRSQLVAREHALDHRQRPVSVGRMGRRELVEIAIDGLLVAGAALAHFLDATPVLQFVLAACAIAGLARLVGSATEQLGGRLGSAGAGAVQSALGNLPELFIALFALHDGLVTLVQAALIGSVLANSVLVLGLAFTVGGLRHGTQSFDSPRARIIATLTVLAAAILSVPSLAHAFHAPAAAHSRTLSFVCAGVLLAVFVLTLPGLLAPLPGEPEHEPPRWSLRTTAAVLALAAAAAALVSDWFVSALRPAIETLHMSQSFAGLVVVAI